MKNDGNPKMGSYMVPDPLSDGMVEVLGASEVYGDANPPRKGKVRDVYDLGEELLIVTSDRISSFDVVFPNLIPHKGRSLHALSVFWFKKTEKVFPNHFKEMVDDRSMRVTKAERIDVEWVCRAYLYGSAWRAYRNGARTVSGIDLPDGLVMAEELPEVIITPTTKSDVGHDMEISREKAIEQSLITRDEWDHLEEATHNLFTYYRETAKSRGFIIPDFKLEFGRLDGGLIQIDEPPTHDSARYWAEAFYEPGKGQEATCLDKEFLRECLRRIGYIGDGPPPVIPEPVIREVSKRCIASHRIITGQVTLKDLDLKTVDEVMKELET
ncbi:phosphoribosylaminoimidazolesuccinocarboxamide synthase [Candidatus Bathyarchaeota archaeon]|jgi:phosphoribosylaminoimidazole-succinocarboxamide synthase|nr:phosphoribosylaminoimidazolesuccinocarboxamide synthase [Candidatus Bathyarchaeota archaeon]MDP6048178.1 phosphoribosylaminoimidazolesuccinocarboxamide synthase [Candidatus Bathyarchaeota archaeon]MDP7442832.1 phosphoribosylaminoimidazolesuccinocarboxamide synthase [Candidatus Bathyarchaeota archaeon]|tara:strand:- start:295 stop:1272 length:978 start_codon:yes stop_codon:yes gene_type:complete